jgi:peptidoglycan hydrolase CwlO-like protein
MSQYDENPLTMLSAENKTLRERVKNLEGLLSDMKAQNKLLESKVFKHVTIQNNQTRRANDLTRECAKLREELQEARREQKLCPMCASHAAVTMGVK